MRNALIALWIMLLASITSVAAQVSVGIGLPGVSIGINVPVYPELVPVPGYPVYYAPQVSSNYFFYDGMYWVYQRDNWYASSWYNGPWMLVAPEAIPLFVLRVPVRYYRQPPVYFRGWRSDAPPHWGEHWGNSWEQSRSGWDMWDRHALPPPAPLPVYQRQYSGNRYPRLEQQQALQTQNYRYQPQDDVVRQHYQAQPVQSAPAPSPQARQAVPPERSAAQDQRVYRPPSSVPKNAAPVPRGQPPQTATGDVQRPAATQALPQPAAPHPSQQQAQRQQQAPRTQAPENGPQGKPPAQASSVQRQPQQPHQAERQTQQPQQGAAQRQEQAPRAQGQDKAPQGKGPAQEPKPAQGKGSDKGEQQGGEHSK